jgi:hypothetical protein
VKKDGTLVKKDEHFPSFFTSLLRFPSFFTRKAAFSGFVVKKPLQDFRLYMPTSEKE